MPQIVGSQTQAHTYRCDGCGLPGFQEDGQPIGRFFGLVLTRRRWLPPSPGADERVVGLHVAPFVCSRACLAFIAAAHPRHEPQGGELIMLECALEIDGERVHVMTAPMPGAPQGAA